MNSLLFTLSPRDAIAEAFDGHASIDDAITYWGEMPAYTVAFGPRGFELDVETILALAPWARLVKAAEAVLSDNTGDLDQDTRSGCLLVGQDTLRQLRTALSDTYSL